MSSGCSTTGAVSLQASAAESGLDDDPAVLVDVRVGPVRADQGGGEAAPGAGQPGLPAAIRGAERRQAGRREGGAPDGVSAYTIVEERPLREGSGIIRDEVIVLDSEKDPDHLMQLRRIEVWLEDQQETIALLTNNLKLAASTIASIYRDRWQIGVSSQGHIVQSVKDRPRPRDSGLVAWEAPWRESKTAEPSDNMLRKECAQRTRLQRAVNTDVASLHESPVAETVDNARKQQGLAERSPMRQPSPAGYQRRHGGKDDVETGEALGARRRKLVEEMPAITVRGKCRHRRQGDGSGRSTADGRAAKRARREGPRPVSIPFVEARQG
jgi:hypothetical protein